ncbi:MAG: hypothetical protein P4M00_11330 [Azospirillaceae bacterium]|nr:hypothetical protein [Azospirillaceae bacterium]
MIRLMGVLAAGCLAAAALATGTMPAHAADKQPPTCAAISFRPLASGMADGDYDAGLYQSRFARITLKGTVKGGTATNYFLTLNGKQPETLKDLPKTASGCLASKHVVLPAKTQPAGACTGDRFRVVIFNTGKEKVTALFGLHGAAWDLCTVNKA